jgi:transcriptional regulator NrdR family protein
MKCPHCSATRIKVVATKHLDDCSINRYRTCLICKQSWHTKESQIFKDPTPIHLLLQRGEGGKFLPLIQES